MSRKQQFTVQLSDDIGKAAQEYAAKNNTSLSAAVRELVALGIEAVKDGYRYGVIKPH